VVIDGGQNKKVIFVVLNVRGILRGYEKTNNIRFYVLILI